MPFMYKLECLSLVEFVFPLLKAIHQKFIKKNHNSKYAVKHVTTFSKIVRKEHTTFILLLVNEHKKQLDG